MDPIRDLHIIKDELAAKDLQLVEKNLAELGKKAKKSANADLKLMVQVLEKS